MTVSLTAYSSGCIDCITKFSKTITTFCSYLQRSNHRLECKFVKYCKNSTNYHAVFMTVHIDWWNITSVYACVNYCIPVWQQESLANAKVNARQHCVVRSHSNASNAIWRTTMFHVVAGAPVVAPNTRNHAKFKENSTLQQFKVIQGHRSWCQWKAHMWLPISH